jgi:exodeoxyribonuclease VIII
MSANLDVGIHHGIPMEEYLALPHMSGSKLEKLRRSPLQLLHSMAAPRGPSSDAMNLGSAAHCLLLEPDLFTNLYVRGIDGDGRTKAVKDARAALAAEYPFATILNGEQWGAVTGIRDSVMAHRRARTLFEGEGAFEATVIWRDEESGVLCKARPDRLVERAGMHVALKTTRDAAPWSFPRDAEKLGYFRSLAFYRRGLRAVGWPYKSTAVLAVESVPPFDLVPYLPEEDSDLDSADAEVSRLLRLYRTCEADASWPGYSDDFMVLNRPAWAKEQAA